MKIRTDFVTNSSSSSFIIGTKDELTKEKILEFLGVSDKSPLYGFAEDLSDFIIGEVKKKSVSKLLDYFCVDDISELPKDYREIIPNGYNNIYMGYASDEEYGVEQAFCNMSVNHKTKDMFMIKEGGY